MVISWICLNLNIVYVIITKMVKIRDSTKPWSPFIHIDRRNSFTLDLRKQGKEVELIIEDFPDLGICADVNHMKDERPEEFIAHFGEKIKMIHMADYDRVDEKHWPPGWGENNWNNIILELIQAKYDGPFIYEVVSRFATVEELSENYKNLINNFKGWINNI